MPSIRLASITITAALVTVLGSTTTAQEPPPERAYTSPSWYTHGG